MSKNVTKRKKGFVRRSLRYFAGSAAFCVSACVIFFKFAPYITGAVNKTANKISNAKKSDDDWGPIIEKKYDATCKGGTDNAD